jgi:hypothetical protein
MSTALKILPIFLISLLLQCSQFLSMRHPRQALARDGCSPATITKVLLQTITKKHLQSSRFADAFL